MEKSVRIGHLDALKGMAILLVIFGHITQKYEHFDLYSNASNVIGIIKDIVYSFHMHLFMLISGFLYFMAYISTDCKPTRNKRLRVRCIDLILIYFFFSIFEGVVKLFFSSYVVSSVSYKDMLLILLQPIGGRLWYIYVLIEYYIFFSFDVIRKNIGKWWMLLIVLLISISNVFMSYEWWFSIRCAARDLLPFYTGILLCKPECRMAFNSTKFIIVSSLTVLLRIYLYMGDVFSNTIPVLSVLYGVIVSVWIFIAFERITWLSNISILRSLGMCAMEMYLFHEYPLTLATIVLPRIIKNVWLSIAMCMIFTVSTVLMASALLRRFHLDEVLLKPYKSLTSRKNL